MSLRTPEDEDFFLTDMDALGAERGLDDHQANRAYWFGYRPGDGRTIDPAILDLNRTALEIAAARRFDRDVALMMNAGMTDAEIVRAMEWAA